MNTIIKKTVAFAVTVLTHADVIGHQSPGIRSLTLWI